MTDDEVLEERRRGLRKSLESFSGGRKRWREVWVCTTFLANLGVAHSPSEVVSAEDEPPDVLFRDARFEVKERLDPGRRRTDEYRHALRLAEHMPDQSEVFTHFEPGDLTPDEILTNMLPELASWSNHYEPRLRASLDVLVYYNAVGKFFNEVPTLPDATVLPTFGFRSVSVTTDSRAWVIWAGDTAPAFLKTLRGGFRRSAEPSVR